MKLISKIFVLQSLEPIDEIKSGELLANNLKGHIEYSFSDVKTKEQLFLELEKIKEEIINNKGFSIIHFDAHGNESGVALFQDNGDASFVKWEEFRIFFRHLYVYSKVKPIISFSSCKGFNVMNLIAALEPCPYDIITGSLVDIPFQDSVDGYTLFYRNLDCGKPFSENIQEVRTKFPELNFIAYPAEALFEKAWEKYKEIELSPERVKERKRNIVSQIISITGTITPEQEKLLDSGLSPERGEKDYEEFKQIFFS